VHKNWNTYVYLESPPQVGILRPESQFIVSRCPLEFTNWPEIRFLPNCLFKSVDTFTPVIQFCITHLKTLPVQSPASHFWQYIAVHYFTLFPVWRLLFSAPTRHEL